MSESKFVENYSDARDRLRDDSKSLADMKRWHNASYLLGLATECAIKACAQELIGSSSFRKAHLPDLMENLKNASKNARAKAFRKQVVSEIIPNDLNEWSIDMRYAGNDAEISEEKFNFWKTRAIRIHSICCGASISSGRKR
jgi:HEPN domain-containing protein